LRRTPSWAGGHPDEWGWRLFCLVLAWICYCCSASFLFSVYAVIWASQHGAGHPFVVKTSAKLIGVHTFSELVVNQILLADITP
jgi:hypothetical protein